MDAVWLIITVVFFGMFLLYVSFLAGEGKTWKT
jgi:hypothetical protein